MAVFVVRRESKSGPRWVVRYQPRRGAAQLHCGSFKRADLAAVRKAWCEAEVAAGRVPDPKRIGLVEVETTMRLAALAYLASRVDAKESSRVQYQIRCAAILERWDRDAPTSITRDDVQRWVNALGERYAPRTVRVTVQTLAQVLDHAGVEPNPARLVRLPRVKRDDKYLPTRDELANLIAALPERYARVVVLLEHTGLRISEALALQWGDVDQARRRIRVKDSKTSSGRRFVDHLDTYPGGLVAFLDAPGPKSERVFPGATSAGVQFAMRARNPRVSPHSMRHLHASRMLHDGVLSPAQLAARLGHSTPAVTLGTYSHCVPPD